MQNLNTQTLKINDRGKEVIIQQPTIEDVLIFYCALVGKIPKSKPSPRNNLNNSQINNRLLS